MIDNFISTRKMARIQLEFKQACPVARCTATWKDWGYYCTHQGSPFLLMGSPFRPRCLVLPPQ